MYPVFADEKNHESLRATLASAGITVQFRKTKANEWTAWAALPEIKVVTLPKVGWEREGKLSFVIAEAQITNDITLTVQIEDHQDWANYAIYCADLVIGGDLLAHVDVRQVEIADENGNKYDTFDSFRGAPVFVKKLTVSEVAALADVDRSYVKAEITAGRLKAEMVGKQYEITQTDFEAWNDKPGRGSRSK